MITPPSYRNRFPMALTPRTGGRMRIAYGPDAFDEFFDAVGEDEVRAALGDDVDREYSGEALAAMVDVIEEFLANLPADGPTEPIAQLYESFWTEFLAALHDRFPEWSGVKSPPADPGENESWLSSLSSALEEGDHGLEVVGEDLPGRRAARLAIYYPDEVTVANTESWPDVIAWSIETLDSFRNVAPLLAAL